MSERDRSKDKNGGKKKSGRGWALQVFLLAVVLLAWMGVFSVPLSFCMEGIVRGLCAVTAFPFQLAQYYFF